MQSTIVELDSNSKSELQTHLNDKQINNGNFTHQTIMNDICGSSAQILEGTMMVDNECIGYCTYGTGRTKMIFLCGGVGCYRKDFPETLLKNFDASAFTIICIDPPGYGTSRPPDRKQDMNRCFKDAVVCKKFMEMSGITSYIVLGWSEGTRTAVHLADIAKNNVKALILLAPSTRIDRKMTEVFRGLRDVDLWIPEALNLYLEHYSIEFVRKQWADLCDHLIQVYEELGGRFPADYIVPRIQIPTLVLAGNVDKICNDPNYFKINIKVCRTDVHLRSGHDFYLKHPKWLIGKINKFFDEFKEVLD